MSSSDDDGAGCDVARGDEAFGEVLAVDQLALAERALGELLAARRFHFADAGDECLEFLRLEARGMVGTFHLAVERDVALDDDGAERDRAVDTAMPRSWPE